MSELRPILEEQHKDKSTPDCVKWTSADWEVLDDKSKYKKKAAALRELKLEQTSSFRKFQKQLAEWKKTRNESFS